MNKTQNYQLNQWEAGDKVQRVDFNADNAKIDAAIKAQAESLAAEHSAREAAVAALEDKHALHLIKSAVVSVGEAFQMDVSDVNWAQWREVLLMVELKMDGPFVKIDAGEPLNTYTLATCNKSVNFPILLFPFYRDDIPVAGLALGNNSSVAVLTQLTYQTIADFHMSAHYEAHILSGSRMTLYGIK